MGRAPCCDKTNVKKGPWSPDEDAKLKAYIDQFGTGGNWIALPQKIGLKRCGKSCRLRWLNYLRPNIKHGGFTEEEDNIICSLYISIGSRWSIIAAQLPGRTDNDIKNYWNTKLKKKLLGRRKQPGLYHQKDDKRTTGDGGSSCGGSYIPTLSSSALERLQLHMQFQSIQNPLLYFSDPTPWPKLHPQQEKMIQNLQFLNDSIESTTSTFLPQSPQQTGHDIASTMIAKDVAYNADMQKQAELGDFSLTSNSNGEIPDQFDTFREMDVSKESMMSWWSNELSCSCDTTTPVAESDHESVFQDYPLGYGW